MAVVTTVGALFLIYGDFSKFVIVDRLGTDRRARASCLRDEPQAHGPEGLVAIWRNGSKVIDAGAFRVLIGLA